MRTDRGRKNAPPPRRRGCGFWALLVSACLVSFPAAAQQDTDARLNRLENEIQTLSRAVFRNEMPPPEQARQMSASGAAAQAGLDVRVSQMERELANLTGKIEQQGFELRQMQENFEKALAELESRLARSDPVAPRPAATMRGFDTRLHTETVQDVPAGASLTAPDMPMPGAPATGDQQLGSLTQTPDGTYAAPGGTPADMYEQAFALLRDKQYDAAERSFTDFLTRYPGHDLAANAKYWLGETFYVRGNFERAARVFAEAYQLYPKGPKGPDNLLKLALSLNGMGKKDDACLTLAQLKNEYPAGAAPVLARADRERDNFGCR